MKSNRRKKIIALAGLVFLIWYIFALPKPLFKDPVSTILLGADDQLLGAKIAQDGQWRFPGSDSIPEKFKQAIIHFEDKRFFKHPGVDVIAILRAVKQNWSAKKVVSGGSTLSMQTIRLSRKGKSRSIFQKLIEAIYATRLELRHSKNDILSLYAEHAPFGGNVVGLHTASWRYFGVSPDRLSWGQAACLAVLPNAPSLIHPGRNRNALLRKRNRLLDQLLAHQIIDKQSCTLAKLEPIPEAPLPLPRLAPHLIEYADRKINTRDHALVKTSINTNLQHQLINISQFHRPALAGNAIHNLAILVLDVEKKEVIGYLGNLPDTGKRNQEDVDIIRAARSTGSILKPFLYGLGMDDGLITPKAFLTDIPTNINGYRPENFHRSYQGVISADRALIRSLNIPFVHLLQDYQIERFKKRLQQMSLHSINRSADNYGLTLILGGAEASLWELTNAYAGMAHTLNFYNKNSSRYPNYGFKAASFYKAPNAPFDLNEASQPLPGREHSEQLSAGSIWATFEAMKQLERPNEEGEWEYFSSVNDLAWKTGTSIGFRDAWAIGVNSKFAIGVWVGNADGEGRPGLIGARAAAPILFDVFRNLKNAPWFEMPYDDLEHIPICQQSGSRATEHCPSDSLWVPKKTLTAQPCSFHQLVFLDDTGKYRIHKNCGQVNTLNRTNQFVLPTIEAHYYAQQHPDYTIIPPWHPDCQSRPQEQKMKMIYPLANARIKLPKDLDGSRRPAIFEAAHMDRGKKIYWRIDENFIGVTKDFHSMEIDVPIGEHLLTLTDEDGFQFSQRFTRIEGT